MEKFGALGAHFDEVGITNAFYIAQPTALFVGFMIVLVLSLICMFIAIFGPDMSKNTPFIVIATVGPFAILLISWFAQIYQNSTEDNRFKTIIENYARFTKAINVNQV